MTRTPLFTLHDTVARDPAIDAWIGGHANELGAMAQHWFGIMRGMGAAVRERLHDDQPTVCVGEAAFAYVAVHKGHVNVGFFRGAHLEDPARLLQGAGKNMRHVKLRPDAVVDPEALAALLESAYADIVRCLAE